MNLQPLKAFGSVLIAILGVAGCVAVETTTEPQDYWAPISTPFTDEEGVEERIDGIVVRMSIEEKVGQIIMAEIQSITPAEVRQYHIGAILNGGGSYPSTERYSPLQAWVDIADAFYDASMDNTDGKVAIPIIWGTDAVHGHNNVVGATLFPHNVGLGAMRNRALMREIGAATAREVAATGINWTFAPTVAVARDDRWGRTYESYSEAPEIVAQYAKEMVIGLQGHPALGNVFSAGKVVATAKHFIGDGGTTLGDDQGDTQIDERSLKEIHGAGHIAAIEAGAQTVMATFNSWNGVKTHGNKYLLTEVLKNQLGFDGFVVGDWDGHEQIPGCTSSKCAQTINAGVDMVMVPTDWKEFYNNTIRQVRKGDISTERLNDAVRRILRVKIRAGLFEKGRPSTQPFAGQTDIIGNPQHRALARQAVRESLVLLKNAGLLPLDPGQKILVAGAAANNMPMQAGGWSVTWQGGDTSNADFPGATTIFAGIQAKVSTAGGQADLSVSGKFETRPDAAIVVFGETPYAEFEGDLEEGVDFESENALKILRALKGAGVPTIAVFLSGRPRWVTPEIDAADAFVAAWLPGSEGAGVADVLFTDESGAIQHNFVGKLSFTWPASPDQQPINIGDAQYEPLFPFGFGLNYQDDAPER
ncbi:MAG: glycoside hydrolase family 3 protein [Alphaproteobacteria bacterium]|nr:glycoside hydrolase family 3 protein [Alphaproteobacteria bacterium]